MRPWDSLSGVADVRFVGHDGESHGDWLVDDQGVAWVPQQWLCKRTDTAKLLETERNRTHPFQPRLKILPVAGPGVEPPILPGTSNSKEDARGVVNAFRKALGTAVGDWQLRRGAVAAISRLGSREAVAMALQEAGYGGLVAREEPPAAAQGGGAAFCNLHVDALKKALAPVAAALGVQRDLGPYLPGQKEEILARLVVSGQHWSLFLRNRRRRSVLPGGVRDQQLLSVMRRWKEWRPVVVRMLPSVQRALANVDVRGTPLSRVLRVDSVESLPPANLSLAELVLLGPLLLLLRASTRWRSRKHSEDRQVDNCHLRAVFTTQRGGGGPLDARPDTYSLVQALKEALPEQRAALEDADRVNGVVLEGCVKRLELAPEPKRTPHPLTWLWYCVQLEGLFWRLRAAAEGGRRAAEVLRVAIVCQLAGVTISSKRSEEPGKLVVPGHGCQDPACDLPDCHSNRVVLDDRPGHSVIVEAHGKWQGTALNAHQIAIPDTLAALFREWQAWGRAAVLGRSAEAFPFLLCSSGGQRLSSAYTIRQAKGLLRDAGVDVSDWGETSNVRDVRTSCIRETPGTHGLAYWVNEAVKAEQAAQGEEPAGLQGGMSDQQLVGVWKLLVETGRTSGQQAERHYTSSVRKHTEMAELLGLVRKHFVEGKKEPPFRTDFTGRTGQRFPKSSAKRHKPSE